ncbi:MAG: hypothetical protein JSR76_08650 [Verrucomicrobia bacterium]|nr:hypothetical protein [Verrucomicrobiota bacterium]
MAGPIVPSVVEIGLAQVRATLINARERIQIAENTAQTAQDRARAAEARALVLTVELEAAGRRIEAAEDAAFLARADVVVVDPVQAEEARIEHPPAGLVARGADAISGVLRGLGFLGRPAFDAGAGI